MKNVCLAFLSFLAITNLSIAQNTENDDEARRAAKWEKIAKIRAQEQKEAQAKQNAEAIVKPASQKQTDIKIHSQVKGKFRQGNCSAFIQPVGAIKNYDQRVLIIDAPGYYYFTENIRWSPNHCPNSAAIVIVADNVTLDLKGYQLSAMYADTNRQYTGISILASNNVTIKNGTISGMTYYGIEAEISKNITIENVTVSNMKYYNVNKMDTLVTPCGIILSGVNTFSVKNTKVRSLSTTSSSCAGIQIVGSKNGTFLYDTITSLKNYDGSVQGFSYIDSDSIKTSYCHSSSFQSYYQGLTSTMGHTVLGFIPSMCHYLNYESCSAVNMIGCCDDCHGMSIFLDSAVTINNFTAKNIVDGPYPYNTGAKATGLEVYGYNITVTNSTVDSIIATVPQDLQSTGFSAWGNSITFNNCTAKNVVVKAPNGMPDTKYGYGTGFGWAPDPRTEFDTVTANNVTYSNCMAVNCQLGFDTWYYTNSTWNNNRVQNCTIPMLIEPPTTQRVLYMNKCSESPTGKPISVTLTNKSKNNKIEQPTIIPTKNGK